MLSAVEREICQKNEAVLLQRMASVGQSNIAKTLEISEPTVSRWKDGDIGKTAQTLAVLGLKVVPVGVRCFDPVYVDALMTLAKKGLHEDVPQQLEW